jgi:phenylpropionate dioxygenase-like ring-hydroxylating dioxygenase large terminal subunit
MNTEHHQHTALPLPKGWYAVAFSKDLVEGEVKRVKYFGEDLVLFRTRSGAARLLDGYCAHLGAHIGEGGRVVGESVRCPFHGWQYDGISGECVEIPYCQRVPSKARVRPWQVIERNLMIFAWYHAEGMPPEWDVPLVPELTDDDWTEPRYFDIEVPVHIQDMAENNCDPVHFQVVHDMESVPETQLNVGEDGRFFRITDKTERDTALGRFEIEIERDAWQIGLNTVRTKGIPGAGLMMFASTSPVDSENTVSRWIFTVSKNLVDIAGEEFIQRTSLGVEQDLRIWENKIYRANPVLCEADEYLTHFRSWVKQFYTEADRSRQRS